MLLEIIISLVLTLLILARYHQQNKKFIESENKRIVSMFVKNMDNLKENFQTQTN